MLKVNFREVKGTHRVVVVEDSYRVRPMISYTGSETSVGFYSRVKKTRTEHALEARN